MFCQEVEGVVNPSTLLDKSSGKKPFEVIGSGARGNVKGSRDVTQEGALPIKGHQYFSTSSVAQYFFSWCGHVISTVHFSPKQDNPYFHLLNIYFAAEIRTIADCLVLLDYTKS